LSEPLAILIADQDLPSRDALTVALTAEGFTVVTAADGPEALERYRGGRYALVVLGADLPEINGLDVCRVLRARSKVPIIVLTSSPDEAETVRAFESGADDCVPKPPRPREFVARARAALRRVPPRHDRSDPILEVGAVRLDPAGFGVSVRGEPVELTLKEFELLRVLMANAGRTLTRRVLIERVWGGEGTGEHKSLDTHVRRLRAKIEDAPSNPAHIITIRGLGYRFNK